MVDLAPLADAAARDQLLGAFVLMATGALVSRLLFKQQPIWRAIVRVVFLILLTLLLLHNGIVPYEPLHSTGTPFHDVIVGTLKIAWWPRGLGLRRDLAIRSGRRSSPRAAALC